VLISEMWGETQLHIMSLFIKQWIMDNHMWK